MEIKPCPMCGCTPTEVDENGYGAFWICCDNCGLGTSEVDIYNAEQAIERWNTRSTPSVEEAREVLSHLDPELSGNGTVCFDEVEYSARDLRALAVLIENE